MSLFKIPLGRESTVETPALLFLDLKRDPAIKFLWGHQEKVLDAYHGAHLDAKDVAIELPTGTGKTLVGLMIGEYRRRSKTERVVFLCPTKQLAAQVHRQAEKYGVPACLLIGAQSFYDEGSFYRYQRGQAIAISTYSGLFNINPRLSDPHIVICDDAHSAEGFVSDMWTLRITRGDHARLFQQLESLLDGVAGVTSAGVIAPDNDQVELISPIAFDEICRPIADLVSGFLDEYSALAYPWKFLSQHLSVCNIYRTRDAFEIRPVTPPTLTHAPFSSARQRVYMSATLGEDGDLERSFGIRKIARLPVPEGWDKRGTGRRLILFPELSTKVGPTLLPEILKQAKRTLILVPSNRVRETFASELQKHVVLFTGADVDQNVQNFRKHDGGPAALILANRYDGIDFPDDECRCLVICGFPLGASLQETFLVQRLKAMMVARDRVRTRITQAMGRCTRGESDYAVVVAFGDDLMKWFCTTENVAGMHPELQAEVAFGIENSSEHANEVFLDLTRAFLERSAEWDRAEEHIKAERAKSVKHADPGAAALQKAAELEIDFTYALWNGTFERAYDLADKVLACLSGGEEMRAYRCFWQHQAAVAAFLQWKQSENDAFRNHAITRLSEAAKANLGIRWLSALATKLGGESLFTEDIVPLDEWFAEIERLLRYVGTTGAKFGRLIAEQRDFIAATEAKKFHQGLEFLGKLLGARTHVWPEGSPTPDGFWGFGFTTGYTFEAKTDQFTAGTIGISTVRQAKTHERCVEQEKLLPTHAVCHTVVVSPRTMLERDVRIHCDDLYHCSHAAAVDLFDKAAAAFTAFRTIAAKVDTGTLADEAERIYRAHGCFVDDVGSVLRSRKLADLHSV